MGESDVQMMTLEGDEEGSKMDTLDIPSNAGSSDEDEEGWVFNVSSCYSCKGFFRFVDLPIKLIKVCV